MSVREMKRNESPSSLTKTEVIEKWTSRYGEQNLYTSAAKEAEQNIINTAQSGCKGIVCEVGCGDGRVARHFPVPKYIGVDINPAVVKKAHKRCPHHNFEVIDYDQEYPKAETFLFYTVLLHVPDCALKDIFARVVKAGATRIVIYEVMCDWIRDYARHDNFHRDPSEFVEAAVGFHESNLYFVKSKFFPWFGNVLVLEKDI